MQERRKHGRRIPDRCPTVYENETGRTIGGLADISVQGAKFITLTPVKPATVFICRVELSRPILGCNEIIFEAECRWCRKNIKTDRWESGYYLRLEGIHAELISYLTLSHKLGEWGDDQIPDILTEELEDRRAPVRYHLEDTLLVYEQNSYRQIGVLGDLSTQGIRLVSREPIQQDNILHCRVMLRKPIFQEDSILFDTKCMWSREEGDGTGYESGHKIISITEKNAAIILNLLIHHAQEQSSTKRIRIV